MLRCSRSPDLLGARETPALLDFPRTTRAGFIKHVAPPRGIRVLANCNRQNVGNTTDSGSTISFGSQL